MQKIVYVQCIVVDFEYKGNNVLCTLTQTFIQLLSDKTQLAINVSLFPPQPRPSLPSRHPS